VFSLESDFASEIGPQNSKKEDEYSLNQDQLIQIIDEQMFRS